MGTIKKFILSTLTYRHNDYDACSCSCIFIMKWTGCWAKNQFDDALAERGYRQTQTILCRLHRMCYTVPELPNTTISVHNNMLPRITYLFFKI